MKFNIFDKYILDKTFSNIKTSESLFKDAIKKDYLNMNKIFNDSKTVTNDEAKTLIKSNKSFVVGVNFFDNKKTDFYLLSNDGITIPISFKNKVVINDELKLEKELSSLGYQDVMSFKLKSKEEIFKLEDLYKKYKIKKDMDIYEIKSMLSLYATFNTRVVPNSFYKIKPGSEKDILKVLLKSNDYTKSLYEKVSKVLITEGEALSNLNENGFSQLRTLTRYKETVKDLLSLLKEGLHSPELYDEIKSERLEMDELNYDKNKLRSRDLIKISFNESKLKSILSKEFLESAYIEKGSEIKINKPVKTLEEYENFLKIEEYIKKSTTKKIEMDINNIPTLEDIFEKEFNMKR